jgi:antitoxin component of MazEF toxin-antitoxin module
MAKRKNVNDKTLLKMIEDGIPQVEIMSKMGFKNSSQLKVAYANALMKSGKAPELKRGRSAARAASTQITVGKRGSLIIPKALVAEFGLKQGDAFEVKNAKTGIRLKRIG